MEADGLTHTLDFQLDIREGDPSLLTDGTLESRRVVNEIFRLDKEGWDWDDIEDAVVDRSDHVQNTTQRLVAKATTALREYYGDEDHNYGRPNNNVREPFPIRMNHGEGYDLSLDGDTNDIHFRVSALKHNHVRGVLTGSPDHVEQLQTALQDEDDEWRVGTAEVVPVDDGHELHVNVTRTTADVAPKEDAQTVVGVDINEDCVALAALDTNDIIDSVVIDYTRIKERRHEFFTIRKRMQQNGQTAFETVLQDREKRYVHDQLHKISHGVVEWVSQFENPIMVFEDLTDMREDIEYGTRMNRRLHSLPFAKLRSYITYKAAWEGIPSDAVDPEYTSQECPRTECEHRVRANRRGKRFKCVVCGCQDHADRGAGISIAKKWMSKEERNVPLLKILPGFQQVRREASGRVDRPTATPSLVGGHQTESGAGVLR